MNKNLSWSVLPLKKLADVAAGAAPVDRADELGEYPVIGANGPIGRSWSSNLRSPAVVVGRVGSAGAVTLVREECWVSDNALIVRPKPGIADERFLAYVMPLLDLASDATQTAQPLITQTQVRSRIVPAPPIVVQRRISDYLDTETTRINAIVASKRQMLGLLGERRQAEIDLAVDGCWLDYGSAPISTLCECIVDCVNKTAPTVDTDTGYKMIRTSNIRDGRVDLTEVDFVTREIFVEWNRRGAPRRGDVLLTREAPLGEVGLLDSDDQVFLGQRIVMYRAAQSKSVPEFLLFVLLSRRVKDRLALMGAGSLHEHLRVGECSKLPAPAAPFVVQERVTAVLERRLETVDRFAAVLARQLDLLVEHRQALITAAVTGDLEIPGAAA